MAWRLRRDLAQDVIEMGKRLEAGRKSDFADTRVRVEKQVLRFTDSYLQTQQGKAIIAEATAK